MRVKCDYCGSYIEDTEKNCPSCGAPNDHMQRSGQGVPKTISELKTFCEARHLPLEQMRFFIGENYTEPKAFGIYQDEQGQFVVYKNKGNGERAIRYRGTDESYAVNEIYQKMRSEIASRKESGKLHSKNSIPSQPPKPPQPPKKKKKGILEICLLAVFLSLLILSCSAIIDASKEGYYSFEDTTYYHDGGKWYYWDDSDQDWYDAGIVSPDLTNNAADYRLSSEYDEGCGVSDFAETDYYSENHSSSSSSSSWDSSWDDDDDWDWDSGWDSSDTDWDSDW